MDLQINADGLYPRFSEMEFLRRHSAVREQMGAEGLDVLVAAGNVASHEEVQYLTNFGVTFQAAVVFPLAGEPALFVQFVNHQPNARRVGIVEDVRWAGDDLAATLSTELRRRGLGGARIGLAGTVGYQHYLALAAALPKATLIDFSPVLQRLRLVKSEEEIAFIRRGAAFCDLALDALERDARPGLTEHELAAIVESAYLGLGGRNVIHFIGVTSMHDPSLCVPAQTHSNRVVRKGDVIVTEISAHYHGYWGQILRTLSVGEGPTPMYARLHEVALDTFERVCGVIRDGASSEAVLDAAEHLHEAGFTIYDDLLHCANGLYAPYLRTRRTTVGEPPRFTFVENMVIVVQPNVITPDELMGVQVGEMLRVTVDGVESMHRHPRRFLRCGD